MNQVHARFGELENELSDPEVIGDRERYAAARRAYSELAPAAKLAVEYRHAFDDAEGARELLAGRRGSRAAGSARELPRDRLRVVEEEIRRAMVEPDPNDDKNVIVGIRPGR